MTFVLPGVFFLILGIGNISVGTYKKNQYNTVLKELSEIESNPAQINTAPIKRIKLATKSAARIYQKRQHARARIEFYELVKFGGQVFVTLSICLLLLAILVKSALEPKSNPTT